MKRGQQDRGADSYPVVMPAEVEMGVKGKMPATGVEDDCGVDELLAALGYKIRSSDMADVAQKLEQLEAAMASAAAAAATEDTSLLPQIASDMVHYNPSDLSSWLDSMLSELNTLPPPLPAPPVDHTCDYRQSSFDSTVVAVAEPSVAITTAAPRRLAGGSYDLRLSPPVVAAGVSGRRVVYDMDGQTEMIQSPRGRKRIRSCSSSSSTSWGGVAGETTGSTAEVASPANVAAMVVDTQEVGIRLVHALLACAEAVQQENVKAADAVMKQISMLAASQSGPMRKVAGYFADALAHRIYPRCPLSLCKTDRALDDILHQHFYESGPMRKVAGYFADALAHRIYPRCPLSLCKTDRALDDILHQHFYESCPYLKFAHFTANQAILEAFAGCRRVHVIDLGMRQGMQWPALLQALALRPGGPPSFRLTGIGPPQPDQSDALEQVGWKLAMLAETIGVDFRYRGFVASSLADLEPRMLLEEDDNKESEETEEVVAVNSVMELHRLLARPGAVEKVLGTVRAVRPRIVTMVEEEANHNTGTFLERFTEALHYYSSMFDSLEIGREGVGQVVDVEGEQQRQQNRAMAEVYMGRQICNVVACEGAERTERHETLDRWRGRMVRAGFETVPLGSNAFKQASMLLALFAGGDGFRVEEADGSLTLGWHTRPLIATSAWRVAGVR